MEIKNFKENMENKEIGMENDRKSRNQILDFPKDYEDDFDEKIDSARENTDENLKKFNMNLHQKLLETETLAKVLTVMEIGVDLLNGITEVKELPNEYEDLIGTVLEVKAEQEVQKSVYELMDDMGYESVTERDLKDDIVDAGQLIAEVGSDEDEALGVIFEEKNEKIRETERESGVIDDLGDSCCLPV